MKKQTNEKKPNQTKNIWNDFEICCLANGGLFAPQAFGSGLGTIGSPAQPSGTPPPQYNITFKLNKCDPQQNQPHIDTTTTQKNHSNCVWYIRIELRNSVRL